LGGGLKTFFRGEGSHKAFERFSDLPEAFFGKLPYPVFWSCPHLTLTKVMQSLSSLTLLSAPRNEAVGGNFLVNFLSIVKVESILLKIFKI